MELPRTTSIEYAIEVWVDEVHKTTDTSNTEIEDYNVSWKKVSIKHQPTTYDTAAQILLQETSMLTKTPSVQILCQSSFENKTDRKEIKLFHATQSTRSIANFHMDNNVQFAPGFKFTLPGGIIKATKMTEINMGDNENTFAEEVTWEVNNSIHVGPHKKVVCQLAVEKYINQGRFTHMVDLSGEILVVAKLSNGRMKPFSGDVREIFKSLLNGEILDNRVRLKVTGQARFHFSIRQRVLVNEKDLDITQASGRKNIPADILKSRPIQPLPQSKPAQQCNPEPVVKPRSSQPVSQQSEQVSPGPQRPSVYTILPPISQQEPSGSSQPVSQPSKQVSRGPKRPSVYTILPPISQPEPFGSSQPVSQPSKQVSPDPQRPSMYTILPPISQAKPSGSARPGSLKPLENIYLPRIQQHPAPQPCYRAVGLKLANGEYKEIIPQKAHLPITERYKHSTMRYFRTESKFYIYERKHHIAEKNKFLACLILYKDKFVPSKIIITFRLNNNK